MTELAQNAKNNFLTVVNQEAVSDHASLRATQVSLEGQPSVGVARESPRRTRRWSPVSCWVQSQASQREQTMHFGPAARWSDGYLWVRKYTNIVGSGLGSGLSFDMSMSESWMAVGGNDGGARGGGICLCGGFKASSEGRVHMCTHGLTLRDDGLTPGVTCAGSLSAARIMVEPPAGLPLSRPSI